MRLVRKNGILPLHGTQTDFDFSSSAKSVGHLWFPVDLKCVKKSNFGSFEGPESEGFSGSEFGFVVEALNNTGGDGAFGAEPVEERDTMFYAASEPPSSSVQFGERMTRVHHRSRKRLAQ